MVFENNEDSDQTPRSAASDLDLHVCQLPFQGSPDYNGLNRQNLNKWDSQHYSTFIFVYIASSEEMYAWILLENDIGFYQEEGFI